MLFGVSIHWVFHFLFPWHLALAFFVWYVRVCERLGAQWRRCGCIRNDELKKGEWEWKWNTWCTQKEMLVTLKINTQAWHMTTGFFHLLVCFPCLFSVLNIFIHIACYMCCEQAGTKKTQLSKRCFRYWFSFRNGQHWLSEPFEWVCEGQFLDGAANKFGQLPLSANWWLCRALSRLTLFAYL